MTSTNDLINIIDKKMNEFKKDIKNEFNNIFISNTTKTQDVLTQISERLDIFKNLEDSISVENKEIASIIYNNIKNDSSRFAEFESVFSTRDD